MSSVLTKIAAAVAMLAPLPQTAVTPAYTTVYSQNFENGTDVMGVQASGAAWNRANTGTNPISGTRSFTFDVTSISSGQYADPFVSRTFIQGQRYRLSAKFRCATPVQLSFGVRQDAQFYQWVAQKTIVASTTPTSVSFEFCYPLADTAASIRITTGLQTFTGLYIDDIVLETVSWDGLLLSTEPFSNTLFGLHINQSPSNNGAGLPWKILRAWDSGTTWSNLANTTQGGAYNWSRLDQWVQIAVNKGAKFMYTLGGVPTWASSNPTDTGPYGTGSSGPISNLSYVTQFVSDLLARIGVGKIHFFELWNEADGSLFWKGTPQQLLDIAAALYPIIKAFDPNIVVIAPNFTASGFRGFETMLFLGIDQYCDAYSYHNYMTSGDRQAMAVSFNFRRMLTEKGITKSLYMTEGSVGDTTPGVITRQVLAQAISGVKTFCYYTLEGIWTQGSTSLGVSPTYNTNSALGDEFANVASWLAGATPIAASYDVATGVSRILARKAGSDTLRLFLWSDTSQTVTIPSSSAISANTVRTITGGSSATSRNGSGNFTVALSPVPVMLE